MHDKLPLFTFVSWSQSVSSENVLFGIHAGMCLCKVQEWLSRHQRWWYIFGRPWFCSYYRTAHTEISGTKWELTRCNRVTTGHIDIGNYRVSATQLAMQSLITRQYTTIEQHKSLKLLFTETRLTSIYCARNSTVSSHGQFPRNARTTYAKERSPKMISQNVLHYLSQRLEPRLPLLD